MVAWGNLRLIGWFVAGVAALGGLVTAAALDLIGAGAVVAA